jgi:2',3'-cyclic-nucleotide 2'-phosphodiesterase (5'-nucleotidase family)
MRAWTTLLGFALAAAGGLAACQGCHTPTPPPTTVTPDAAQKPTVRLYVMSTVAGALEPCGCTKNQLGGFDHLAAFIESQHAAAPDSVVLGAGPLLFLDPEVTGDGTKQGEWKAEAIATVSKDIHLAAWAPGANDWALGPEVLTKLKAESGAALLAANIEGATEAKVIEVGGVKVGLVGVSQPRNRAGKFPDGVREDEPPIEAMRKGIEVVKREGARILVGLAAMPRGEAKRLADAIPELHVLVLGKPFEGGEANDRAKAPELAGSTLIVEASNHLQTVATIDLFVRDAEGGKPIAFADAGGVSKSEELMSVTGRIRDLEVRIDSWERDKTVKPADLAARKADLDRLRTQKAKLEATETPKSGSFFLYRSVEVRNELGSSETISKEMLAYYKRVNEHNKVALADRKPAPVEKDKASYIGVEACSPCHEEERKVWNGTAHSGAYATLQKQFKEYNLDCVSCHVTGYGKPGGSTVTVNGTLQNVGCEECHGPGSLHAKTPSKKGLINAGPEPSLCVTCHHPPHVEGFDPNDKIRLILGPGHGM